MSKGSISAKSSPPPSRFPIKAIYPNRPWVYADEVGIVSDIPVIGKDGRPKIKKNEKTGKVKEVTKKIVRCGDKEVKVRTTVCLQETDEQIRRHVEASMNVSNSGSQGVIRTTAHLRAKKKMLGIIRGKGLKD